jgi:sialate O-acetylesterase
MTRLFYLCLFLSTTTFGQVRLARLFSDHVVLQRQQPIPVWGWAAPGETVKATLAGQSQQTKADATGKWSVRFAPLEAGGPHTLAVTAKSGQAGATDVLIGEVWLCSGQSNMEWPVRAADNFLAEQQNANFPQIRHFGVAHELAITPQQDLASGQWAVCSPQTVGDFTAVGFFFARELAQKLNVPVGLLHSSWGGSMAEGWISRQSMAATDELRAVAQQLPTTWAQADSLLDARMRQRLLGNPRPLTSADETTYLAATFDPANWKQADPFGQWDWKGMNGFRGQGYMARTVDVPAPMTATATTLALAEADGPTKVYINGKLIWEGAQTGVRQLALPAHTWQPGPNRLMIWMGNAATPAWYGLGLQGAASDLYLSNEAGRISLAGTWRLMPSFAAPHSYNRFVNNLATGLYNAMLHPLVPFGVRGVLWYQGESNAGRAYQYRQTFPLLINDWRKQWGRELPFYFVQLSSFGAMPNSNQGSDWAELREAQTMTLGLPQTGMAVTTDIGNPRDIHPTNKQDVGHRLAVVALKQTYNVPGPDGSPLYEKAQFEGEKAIITFKNASSGLSVKDKYGYLRGFEIAGADRVFYFAQARIESGRVVVAHPNVPTPVAVRYAWTNAPEEANLFSTDGFPASPFRTDDWPGVTQKTKFEW